MSRGTPARSARPLCLLFWLLLASHAWPQPAVTNVSPRGVRPGATVELTVAGQGLEDPLSVWTSFPAVAEWLPVAEGVDEVTTRTCRLTLEDDIPPGIGGIVIGSPAGASDVVYLLVDELQTVTDRGDNHSIAEAQEIEIPIAVDGVADGPRSDYYRFHGVENGRLSVEVFAARLGSEMDPVLRLIGPDGREVAAADEDASFGADSRFSVILPETGDYLLEIHDNRYRSGGRYRLRIGDFPLVTVPYPLGGRRGTTRRFEFLGPVPGGADDAGSAEAWDDAAVRILHIPDSTPVDRLSVAARFPGGAVAAATTLAVSELPEVVASGKAEGPRSAMPVTPPVGISGRFDFPGDQDSFEFAALAGQSLTFAALSRSLGSPSIVKLRLVDEDDQQLAESPVTEDDEWAFDYTIPADGMYRMVVEDLLRRGGPGHGYRIEMRPARGFRLSIKPDQPLRFHAAETFGGFALSLSCERQGYDGPVTLSLRPGTPGLTLHRRVIPPGAEEHRVIVAVSESAAAGNLHPLWIVGQASDASGGTGASGGGGPMPTHPAAAGRSVLASNLAARRALNPSMIFPPRWSDGLSIAAIGEEIPAFFSVALAEPAFAWDRESGSAKSTLSVKRLAEGFDAAVSVWVEGLPAGFTYEVEAEGDEYGISVAGPTDATWSDREVRVVIYGEHEGQGMVRVRTATLRQGGGDSD